MIRDCIPLYFQAPPSPQPIQSLMTTDQIFRTGPLLFLTVSLFFAGIANGQVDQINGLNSDDQIQKLLNENKIPALGIGIIREGKLKQVKVFGELKKDETAPFNTIFNVASLTKPVVAMLTLKLVSVGQLSLDQPLDKYWIDPDIRDDPRHKKLTARFILSQRTGFAN
jgi:CubicO group peptidase (beta-lactamase class C family)